MQTLGALFDSPSLCGTRGEPTRKRFTLPSPFSFRFGKSLARTAYPTRSSTLPVPPLQTSRTPASWPTSWCCSTASQTWASPTLRASPTPRTLRSAPTGRASWFRRRPWTRWRTGRRATRTSASTRSTPRTSPGTGACEAQGEEGRRAGKAEGGGGRQGWEGRGGCTGRVGRATQGRVAGGLGKQKGRRAMVVFQHKG